MTPKPGFTMRRQHLLVELYAFLPKLEVEVNKTPSTGLKKACPEGIYMSLSPGNLTLWAGVIFVRRGPYAPAVLRFQISFPPAYPSLPPLVIFSTDIFHPLITPLTTFTYTTDIQDSGTVSATDNERLPPGGFSLRHGFPSWFGHGGKGAANIRQASGQFLQTPIKSPGGSASGRDTPESRATSSPTKARGSEGRPQQVSIYEVLAYLLSTFDDGDVLDTVPLEAAGNPGAWHAWRAHRIQKGKILPPEQPVKDESLQWHDDLSDDEGSPSAPDGYQRVPGGTPLLATTRKPGEWNWDGVWEHRVEKGVEASLAESTLYGNSASGDDLIRFLSCGDDQVQIIKENIIQGSEAA